MTIRAGVPAAFEVAMELESVDPTSATLLGRVGLSPNDQVAWARFVGLYGSRIRGWCRRWGLQEADSEDVTQDVLLRLARKLKALGIPVVFYVSPTVWAWRRGRIKQIARDVDRMLCILPFEEEFYRAHGVRATYVGSPVAEQVPPPAEPEVFRRALGLDPARPTLAVLPGSRSSELRRLLLHGVLHCLGHDHETDDGTMERLERRLRRVWLPASPAPAVHPADA